MKLLYTAQALDELADVLDTIALQSPGGARRVQARLGAALQRLLDHPQSGVATDETPMRRIVLHPYPYVIFYEPYPDEVVIVGIRHGARDPSTMPGRR